MPGTIQVTVLEFKGVSSSSHPSAKSLKVSMGKRCNQTWDSGDFSFPVTKLREDLVVTLLDAGENEIARADIRTIQVIEKGSWDEVFSLEGERGSGHAHMKLQFVLSEEERKRIRVVRETAVKKKTETSPSTNLSESPISTCDCVETSTHREQFSDSQRKLDDIDLVSPKEDLLACLLANSITSSAGPLHNNRKEEESILGSAIPDATDRSQADASSHVKRGMGSESLQVHERVPAGEIEYHLPFSDTRSNIRIGASSTSFSSVNTDKNNSAAPTLRCDPIHESRNQHPLEKTPSNVKKMISAFENSQHQELKSPKKAPVQPQLYKVGKVGLLEIREPKVIVQPTNRVLRKSKDQLLTESTYQSETSVSGTADIVPRNTEPSEAPKDMESSIIPTLPSAKASNVLDIPGAIQKEPITAWERSPVDLTSKKSISSRVVKAYNLPCKQLDFSDSSDSEGKETGIETGMKISTCANIQVATDHKSKSLDEDKVECYSSGSSGMWIFPDNPRHLCSTSDGKLITRTSGCGGIEAKPHQERKISSESEMLEKHNVMHGTKDKMAKNSKKFAYLPESGSRSSPNDPSNGLVGQVIKIAAILGFGVLVLLTRQKEPRKRNRDSPSVLQMYSNATSSTE